MCLRGGADKRRYTNSGVVLLSWLVLLLKKKMSTDQGVIASHPLRFFVPVYFFASTVKYKVDIARCVGFIVLTDVLWRFYDQNFQWSLGLLIVVYTLDRLVFKTHRRTRSIMTLFAFFHSPILGGIFSLILSVSSLYRKNFETHHFSHYYITKSKLLTIEDHLDAMPSLRVHVEKHAVMDLLNPEKQIDYSSEFAHLVACFYFYLGRMDHFLSRESSHVIQYADKVIETVLDKVCPLLETDETKFRTVELMLRNQVRQSGKSKAFGLHRYTNNPQASQYYTLMRLIIAVYQSPSNPGSRAALDTFLAPFTRVL